MAHRITLPQSVNYEVVVTDGVATKRTFKLDLNGHMRSPLGLYLGDVGANTAFFDPTGLTGARSFTFADRNGVMALQDATSLNAMMPTQTGKSGNALFSNGTTVEFGAYAVSISGVATAAAFAYSAATLTLTLPLASTASNTGGVVTKAMWDNLPKLDAAAGGNVFANPPRITTPGSNPNDCATVSQVQAAGAGLSSRNPVRVVDTSSTAQPTANPVIDGVTIALNDRVLFTNLSVGGNNNRVYKATSSLNPVVWVLETDGQAGTGAPTDGDLVFVKEGTTNADYQYAFNGTSWVVYSRQSAYNFSTGLSRTGITVTVDFAPSGNSSATQAVRADDSRLNDSRTPTAHVLDSASHTISGKTAGQVLLATGATTFAFTTIGGDATLNGSGSLTIQNVNSVAIGNLGLTETTFNGANNQSAAAVIATWPIATYRGVRVFYTITRGATFSIGQVVLLHDGTNGRCTVLEDDYTADVGVNFSADINGGNLRLLYTSTNTGTAPTMKFRATTYSV